MHNSVTLDQATRALHNPRLKSIEGQTRGIQRLVDERRRCREIMDHLAALRAAHAVSLQAIEASALHCLKEPDQPLDQTVAQITHFVAHLTR